MREDFDATFARYLPARKPEHSHKSLLGGFKTATPQQMSDFNWLHENQTATKDVSVAVSKSSNASNINDVADVAVWNPQKGEMHESGEKKLLQKGHRAVNEASKSGFAGTPSLAEQGLAAARRGHDWLSEFWGQLTPDEREAAGGQDALMKWKFIASRA